MTVVSLLTPSFVARQTGYALSGDWIGRRQGDERALRPARDVRGALRRAARPHAEPRIRGDRPLDGAPRPRVGERRAPGDRKGVAGGARPYGREPRRRLRRDPGGAPCDLPRRSWRWHRPAGRQPPPAHGRPRRGGRDPPGRGHPPGRREPPRRANARGPPAQDRRRGGRSDRRGAGHGLVGHERVRPGRRGARAQGLALPRAPQGRLRARVRARPPERGAHGGSRPARGDRQGAARGRLHGADRRGGPFIRPRSRRRRCRAGAGCSKAGYKSERSQVICSTWWNAPPPSWSLYG